MTEGTRTEALRKLDGFSSKIGYPDKWRDYTGLVVERGSFVQNRMRCAAFESARELGRLGEPVDNAEWEMPAHTVNAYYHPCSTRSSSPPASCSRRSSTRTPTTP